MLAEGLFTFDRSWNLSTTFSWKAMSCSAYLRWGLVKNKAAVGLFQIWQKDRLFHILYQPSYNLAMWTPFASLLHPSKKGLSFPLSLGGARREYIWKLNWKESLLIYFENWQGAPCSHRQSRNRVMNTFIIVNITPICRQVRDSLEDKSMLLVHFKKAFPLTLLGHSF